MLKMYLISYFVSKGLCFLPILCFFFRAPSYLLNFFLTENMKFIQRGLRAIPEKKPTEEEKILAWGTCSKLIQGYISNVWLVAINYSKDFIR